MPVLSVLIPSYNDPRILRAINALSARDPDKVQVVIQDAGSNEALQKSVSKLLSEDDKFFVESDAGIFDGINKGICNCDGQYILTIGSDDICPLETINSFLRISDNFDVYFCNVKMFNSFGDVKRYWYVKPFNRWMYRLGAQYPHFGMIIRRDLYSHTGMFNVSNKINADYEFFDRLTKNRALKVFLDRHNSIYMQLGGTSTESLSKIMSHQSLIIKYIIRHSPDLIFSPILKWPFKLLEVIIARISFEKIKL